MNEGCAEDTSHPRRCRSRLERCQSDADAGRSAKAARRDLRELLEATVAGGFDIDVDLLRRPTRGEARIALARQVAMYLAHTASGLSKTEVGDLFERDRTTVHHACMVVELRRDDADFDLALRHLERIVRIVAGPGELPCPRWI